MTDRRMIYHWKHGWIPLTRAAALSKAHGSKRGAEKYLRGGNVPLQHRSIRHLSDDDVSALLSHAAHHGDEPGMEKVLGELNRRDAATRAMARIAERRRQQKAAQDAVKERQFDDMVARGDDPESAYAHVYGVSVAKQRQTNAIAQLRANGYRGAGFHDLSRNAFRDELDRLYVAAEGYTRGALLNNEGRRRGIDPRHLLTGNEATARRYASDELKDFWDEHGRLTLEDFRASLLGGRMKQRTSGEAWHQ